LQRKILPVSPDQDLILAVFFRFVYNVRIRNCYVKGSGNKIIISSEAFSGNKKNATK